MSPRASVRTTRFCLPASAFSWSSPEQLGARQIAASQQHRRVRVVRLYPFRNQDQWSGDRLVEQSRPPYDHGVVEAEVGRQLRDPLLLLLVGGDADRRPKSETPAH